MAGLFARWGRWRRLSDGEAREAAEAWRRALGVRQRVTLERLSRYQVTGEDGRHGCSLVGVTWDPDQATIYHTRALTGEDLVHELLHVRHPHWSEDAVVSETARLLGPRPAPRRRRPESVRTCGHPAHREHAGPRPAS